MSYLVFPLLMGGPLLAGGAMLTAGVSALPTILACLAGSLLVELILEQLMPHRWVWNERRRVWSDVVCMGLGALTNQLVEWVALGGVFLLATWLSTRLGFALWPKGWPLWAQFGLGVLLGDFMHYWAHRALHSAESLWAFHQMHHRPDHLYALNFFRMHPVDIAFKTVANLGPLVLLGAPAEVIALWMIASSVSAGSLNHANIEVRTGWLDWIFSTPRLHRFHHSRQPQEQQSNFSNITILFDHVFGTYCRPPGQEVEEVGELGGSCRLTDELLGPWGRKVRP